MTEEDQEVVNPSEPESSEEAENEDSAPQEAEAETGEITGEEPKGEEQSEPESPEEEEKKPQKDKIQRRIDRITKERRDAEEKAQRIASENERLRSELAEKQGGKPDMQPRSEDFDNFDDFAEALSDWKADRKIDQARAQEAQEAKKAAQRASADLLVVQLEQGRAKYDDFDRVATVSPMEGGPTITTAMLEVMQESPIMADIAYHLGKNPDESVKIAGLSHTAQVRELILLEQKIMNTAPAKPKNVTTAPKPIKPVGSSAVVIKPVSDMTDHEYAEWRRKGR